jgi:hypothetical protein
MIISIYEKSNGKIVKIVSCVDSDIVYQYNLSTQNYIQGSYYNDEYYIDSGNPVLIPPAPNEYCVFNFDTKQWVDPRTNDSQWEVVKQQRNTLLAESDWTQLPDVSISNKDQWAIYRQQLRDITTQPDPFNIIWPIKPE